MTADQLLIRLKSRIGSHPDWPGGPVTTGVCMEFLSARARQATIGFGVRPGLRFRPYARQVADIVRVEGLARSLPGLSP